MMFKVVILDTSYLSLMATLIDFPIIALLMAEHLMIKECCKFKTLVMLK